MAPLNILARDRIILPDWIRERPSFTEETRRQFLQSRVVFYPGSGNDQHPVKLFASSRAAFCFVYADQEGCDYGCDPTGYRPVLQEKVTWPKFERPCNFNGTNPQEAHWTVFQRQKEYGPDLGHEFIALLYVRGEAFTVYWDIWARNGNAPYAILIVDHGTGGNFTGHRFGGDQSPMYEWAKNKDTWPDWLLVSKTTKPWPGYSVVSTGDPGGMHKDLRFLYRKHVRPAGSPSKRRKSAAIS